MGGIRIVSGSDDTTVRIWALTGVKLNVNELKGHQLGSIGCDFDGWYADCVWLV